jgi:hypothetical protein
MKVLVAVHGAMRDDSVLRPPAHFCVMTRVATGCADHVL